MIRIYEVRNKGTHRVEYLNIYDSAKDKPDDAFRRNPNSIKFAGRPDLYISLREEAFEDEDKAWEYCMNLWVEYKLLPKEQAEELIKGEKAAPKKRKK